MFLKCGSEFSFFFFRDSHDSPKPNYSDDLIVQDDSSALSRN